MNDTTAIEEARKMHEAGEPTGAILTMLRSKGTSKVISIKVLAELGVPLADAKIIVHESNAWADVRDAHERFSGAVEGALDEMKSEDNKDA